MSASIWEQMELTQRPWLSSSQRFLVTVVSQQAHSFESRMGLLAVPLARAFMRAVKCARDSAAACCALWHLEHA